LRSFSDIRALDHRVERVEDVFVDDDRAVRILRDPEAAGAYRDRSA
jgi:hypothetical protein